MASPAPVSPSDGTVDATADGSVEIELQARREEFALSISRYLAWVCAGVVLVLVVLWLLAPTYPQVLIYAVLLVLLALGAGFYPTLHRRNQKITGLFLVYGPALLVVLAIPLLIPSLMAAVAIGDILAMMTAVMLLGDRGSRWLVGIYALAYLMDVVVVAVLGWSPFPPLEHSLEVWVTGIVSLVIMLTAILILRLIVLGLGHQFSRAQRLNLSLEQQIQVLNETQATLNQERNLLRTLIDTVPANVYIKDTHSRFIDANIETALQMGATTPNELLGKTDFDFFSAELAGKYFADERAILQSGLPLRNIEEPNFDQRTQQDSQFLTTKVPIVNERGEVTGLVGVGLDITERKQAEAQALALAAERQRGRLLRQFITDVSHDFRTPLTMIGTSAYLVGKTTDPVKLTHYRQRIEEQISRLRLLLDTFVELAHLEEQESSHQFQPADLDQLLKTIVERSTPAVAAKNQGLEYRCEIRSALVLGDPAMLSKAITQVVDNAIDYTSDEGKITLRLYGDGENAVVEVADSGIGIAAEHLPRIFDSFFRVDSARPTESGDAGLGLPIAKKIVELMKGHIEVQSKLGEGSVFRIYLPILQ